MQEYILIPIVDENPNMPKYTLSIPGVMWAHNTVEDAMRLIATRHTDDTYLLGEKVTLDCTHYWVGEWEERETLVQLASKMEGTVTIMAKKPIVNLLDFYR